MAAYLVIGGSSSGSGSVADDGPHKLVAQATVINGTYKKAESESSSDTVSDSDVADFQKFGVKNAKGANGSYTNGTGLSQKSLSFKGVYGTIDDPEAAVDAMFAKVKSESEKNQSGDSTRQAAGSPETVNPSGFSNGIMKCQVAQIDNTNSSSTGAGAAKTITVPFCIWGDHSTVAQASAFSLAGLASGNRGSTDDVVSLAAKLLQRRARRKVAAEPRWGRPASVAGRPYSCRSAVVRRGDRQPVRLTDRRVCSPAPEAGRVRHHAARMPRGMAACSLDLGANQVAAVTYVVHAPALVGACRRRRHQRHNPGCHNHTCRYQNPLDHAHPHVAPSRFQLTGHANE